MKDDYEPPVVEIVRFTSEDVIATSDVKDDYETDMDIYP